MTQADTTASTAASTTTDQLAVRPLTDDEIAAISGGYISPTHAAWNAIKASWRATMERYSSTQGTPTIGSP